MIATLIKFTISIGVMVLVFWWADGAKVLQHLSSLSVDWIVLSVVALTVATFSMARRWQIVAAHLGLRLRYGVALREYYLGSLVNQVLPGGVTGDVARAVRARHGADIRTAGLSVALERFLGQIAIFVTLGLGLAVALVLPGGIAWPQITWALPLGVSSLAVLGLLFLNGDGAIPRFARHGKRLQARPELILHGALSCACLIFAFYACARAAGTAIPPTGWATLVPLVLCAMLVPLSIGGWGWREGAAAALFPLIGAAPSAGVAAGLTYGSTCLLAALPALLILLAHSLTNPHLTVPHRGPSCPNPPT